MDTQLPPARCPSELLGEPDQRPARSQRVTAPTAARSRWQPWGDWPGTECDILGVTGRHVEKRREQAGPRAHPSRLTARSISLKGQPRAHPSPAQNSSVAAHHPLNRGQNAATALHSKSFPGRPQATSQTHLLPVPSRTPCSSQMDLLFCKQALQSLPHPHAFVHTISSPWECPSPTVPSSFSSPCLGLPTLKAHSEPHLPDASVTDPKRQQPNFSLNGWHFTLPFKDLLCFLLL